VTDFMSTSQRRVLLPPACPTAMIGGGVTLDSGLWLWRNQWHPWLLRWVERWCFVWVIAVAEGLLFSQLCTAMDKPTDCLWVTSWCWLFSCTERRSWGWALPL